jgi:endonuclease-3 related protein
MQAAPKEPMVRSIFQALLDAFGPQNWWPARTPFEVVVGSILVQNTAWTNAKLALDRLRAARCLDVKTVRLIRLRNLEELIRPAGFFRQKAQTLKAVIAFLDRNYSGSMLKMANQDRMVLRPQLLGIRGIGPETADSILLYAAQHPVFVVDAYARRVLSRHGLIAEKSSYEEIQSLFSSALTEYPIEISGPPTHISDKHPPSAMSRRAKSQHAQALNEMHGLLVAVGKRFCRKLAPDCENCPLLPLLPRSNDAGIPGI